MAIGAAAVILSLSTSSGNRKLVAEFKARLAGLWSRRTFWSVKSELGSEFFFK